MRLVQLASIVAVCSAGELEANVGSDLGAWNVGIDGHGRSLRVVSQEWQRRFVVLNGSRLSLNGGGRVYLADNTTAGSANPHGYFMFQLLGKRLSYTLDLSAVGCSCNAAIYLVSMPGVNISGSLDPRGGDYYCGANAGKGGRGNYCPEMDVLEANKFAAQSTPHICNGTNRGPGYYPMCDWHGCMTNTFNTSATAMCPATECIIDSRKPFQHSVDFPLDAKGNLVDIRNSFEQDGRVFRFSTGSASCAGSSFNVQRADYLRRMGGNLRAGMVLTLSLWGVSNAGMSWLDGVTGCKGDCNVTASTTSFSDLTLSTLPVGR